MIDFGDGREERLAAFELEMRLRRDPNVTRRREAYYAKVQAAREEANRLGSAEVIERLMAHNRGYIRSLLETEDDRFGAGSLFDRYARTFWNERTA
ncbi:hypothetical protein PHIM7_46 [Sinorhizobium phage phiM7]|uniref:Uncharacterized protein n=2 Tax=Emdodecavirus TaxID=1980937 RepID=S5MPE5_9CAUD|nr:hypothetical protein AB690_gp053 [Sinorhizobium phage phiM12]YP_009601171.1 hypothetical protein FDH46_gp046 [Sinorhizobium phage phiM7]AGR47695.1 hypothetical protein SmphiM12_063 [Sinorhizobium phage phiM12]AKF12594.1 hypothetical protein PHIM7_46 [Sinorhizobium phage phiM7]AKF12954.1 hypothetical protein PHIM19_47 [Sinorhizobium phage phiM19]